MSTDTIFGVPLKFVSLLTLVVQNSCLVLVMRYSRTLEGPKYVTSTAVVMAEFLKFVVSLVIYVRNESKLRKMSAAVVLRDVFGAGSEWVPMTVPAILYFVQNNLQYVAVSLLDAATFQVTYQFKIITTALFSVMLLKKTLSRQKWVSLGLLTAGIAIVQFPTGSSSESTVEKSGYGTQFLGLVAVAIACILSGLAGVWFEKVLKGSKKSLFLRNVQLALFSLIPGLIFGGLIDFDNSLWSKWAASIGKWFLLWLQQMGLGRHYMPSSWRVNCCHGRQVRRQHS